MHVFSTTDTIVAIATPPGRGGIGVVRLAGSATRVALADRLTGRGEPLVAAARDVCAHRRAGFVETARCRRRSIRSSLTWFAAPHSYTGDDVVEISGHGSPLLLQESCELAMAAGARLAEPGEFTLRAYLNGRIDLAQAEAVADLVDAVTPLQARAAMDQLEGTLTGAIRRDRRGAVRSGGAARSVARFSRRGISFRHARGGGGERWPRCRARSRRARARRPGRARRARRPAGRDRRAAQCRQVEPVQRARRIATAPSSPTCPARRAICSRERVDIGGVAVTLVDTAGLRDAADVIEAEGVRRARAGATGRRADRSSSSIGSIAAVGRRRRADRDRRRRRVVVVISKIDLPRAWSLDAVACRPRRASSRCRRSPARGSTTLRRRARRRARPIARSCATHRRSRTCGIWRSWTTARTRGRARGAGACGWRDGRAACWRSSRPRGDALEEITGPPHARRSARAHFQQFLCGEVSAPAEPTCPSPSTSS